MEFMAPVDFKEDDSFTNDDVYNKRSLVDGHNWMELSEGIAITPTRLSISNAVRKPLKEVDNDHIHWNSMPNILRMPCSIDDEFDDYGIVTTVDLSMIRNAAANALDALIHKKKNTASTVTKENCLRYLECKAQNYAWGKIGSDALVARLKKDGCDNFTIDEEKPYAELWLGTHPNGMSTIIVPSKESDQVNSKIPLVDYVQTNPYLHLGVEGVTSPSQDYDLTFLFKVLSIKKVLSIQAHPDKLLAAQLHTDHPEIYKDPNHKPEMAVALTDDFEAMSGFRPIHEIAQHLREYPELSIVVGTTARNQISEAAKAHLHHQPRTVLQRIFVAYMDADHSLMQCQLENLNKRLLEKKESENFTDLDELIIKLANQFPGDSGIFAPLLFNHMKLKTGEAFYIGANEPHAYIQGDILECMACSDNVVRAGLTPKVKDVETLVKMLTYKCTIPEITRGQQVNDHCRLYIPPVRDFAIEMIEVPSGGSYEVKHVRSPSLLLVLNGSGTFLQGNVQSLTVNAGKTLFMSANTNAIVTANNESNLKVVRALTNVF
eukprot:CAMPEP_0197825268 /NCGR_PEP_ID=MMETSP1437-20131217/2373_1 /TAXON_ID=49252 ORGANISM="Eucampia antarctica, Strain CCMP1452" /NCGR_SAMPLE_ID=MMETSP1437 /ASSEMBLY_ACC=CAM_ASM_001096 /LENGTH=546 /DNA_ID=CAMNT_0043425197 /DNA_START=46 /DNA_END=1686 /DNA_ORIENTATION=+